MPREKSELRPESHFVCDGDDGQEYTVLVWREYVQVFNDWDSTWTEWMPRNQKLRLKGSGARVHDAGDGNYHIGKSTSPVLTRRPDQPAATPTTPQEDAP